MMEGCSVERGLDVVADDIAKIGAGHQDMGSGSVRETCWSKLASSYSPLA